METHDLSGTTQISDEGIKKHFKNIEIWQPIFELVWNGLDAKASNIQVAIDINSLGHTDRITVVDNGEGIDPTALEATFGRFYESHKKEDAASHGAHGRGRLAFHCICDHASWHTKTANHNALIQVRADNIKHYKARLIEHDAQHEALRLLKNGTVVTLEGFTSQLPSIEILRDKFSSEFGWHLALNASKKITVNNVAIDVPAHELHEHIENINSFVFNSKIIRWDNKPSSEKSFTYLLDSDGKTVYKQLSSFNNKSGFFSSIYINSQWADSFALEQDLITKSSHTPLSQEWKKLQRELNTFTKNIYEDFLRKKAEIEINKYEEDGLFPAYPEVDEEYKKWRIENTKNIVKSIYIADPSIFNNTGKKQKKIIIRLLDRLSISNENEALFDVLNGVLDMDDISIKTLASQLQRTTLENIVSTIEQLKRRQDVVLKIKELMNVHYKDVLETPDLQKIIEANTWLFGHRYETIGAEEDTFTKIAKELKAKVKSSFDEDDLDEEDVGDIEGAQRQTDLFLARKIPTTDSFGNQIFRCLIIEIKRPSVSLNVKHLRQLDDYAGILMRHPEFNSERMHFELVLIGRKISNQDVEIKSRLRNHIKSGDFGLVSDDPKMKRYVLNWYTLLDGFELSNSSMLNLLKLKRINIEGITKEKLVADLQQEEVLVA